MGSVTGHEFITLDGVIDNPAWSFDYPPDPKMGTAIAEIMGACLLRFFLARRCFSTIVPRLASASKLAVGVGVDDCRCRLTI